MRAGSKNPLAKSLRASVGTRKLQQSSVSVRPAIELLAVGASVSLKVVLIVEHEAGELAFKRLPEHQKNSHGRVPIDNALSSQRAMGHT